MANRFEKITSQKVVVGVRVEAVYYMPDVREVLQEQVPLAPGPNDVMVWPEDVGKMDGSWKGHALRRMYLQECTLKCGRR